VRYRRFLQERGLWSEDWEQKLSAEIEGVIAAAVHRAESRPAPAPEEMFDFLFAELTPTLVRQKADLLASLGES